ncbi:MAG: hypothetical protein NC102_10210 [Clostridium sp.]|nr:hypothetical protein [Clostridium sp.]
MKSTKLFFTMLAAIVAVLCTSCNSDDNESGGGSVIPANTQYDFATLASTTKNGSVFTLTKANDTQTITYTSSVSLSDNKSVKTGDRLVIAYTTTNGMQPYQSGPINLLGYILMNNTDYGVGEFNGVFGSEPVRMDVITRTANYINMQLQLYARDNTSSRTLKLVAEPEQLNAAYPELCLIYETKSPGDNQYLGYASFDISDIWTRPTCKGVKVKYQTPDGIKTTTFENNDVVTPKPME